MANKVKIKDEQGNQVFPITHVSAVLNDNGDNIGEIVSSKQNELVSGSNIKTVNGQSLLGSGNINIYAPSTADINLNGSVITVTNNAGDTESIDVLASTDERVQIAVTTEVQGVSVSGLVINAYYNNAETPSATVTLDANGMGSLRVPNGYKYRLVFPSIQGCKDVPDVVHTASVSQRSVEVEYEEYVPAYEEVTFGVREYQNISTSIPADNVAISVTVDGSTSNYTTDSSGEVSFNIPIGSNYVVTVNTPSGFYVKSHGNVFNLTAVKSQRYIGVKLMPYQIGVFIVDSLGLEYTLDEWKVLVEGGQKENANAKLIKIATEVLCESGGVFAVDIDAMRNRSYDSMRFGNIITYDPPGLNTYKYDGLRATEMVLQTVSDQELPPPVAALYVYNLVYELAGERLQGFIGGVGQMAELWYNRQEIDEILEYVRPNGVNLWSTFTANKWTITQTNSMQAYSWDSNITSTNKDNVLVVIPFFAC